MLCHVRSNLGCWIKWARFSYINPACLAPFTTNVVLCFDKCMSLLRNQADPGEKSLSALQTDLDTGRLDTHQMCLQISMNNWFFTSLSTTLLANIAWVACLLIFLAWIEKVVNICLHCYLLIFTNMAVNWPWIKRIYLRKDKCF